MRIDLLKTFIEVSRTLHFRIAAEHLFITQSAVSARIKLLEDELGVLLFDRSQRHLQLTTEGHRLLKHAHDILFAWQKAKQDVAVADAGARQLVIGAISSIWDVTLHQWLTKLIHAVQDISVITENYTSLELNKHILNGVIDVAFLFEPTFVEEVVCQKVISVPLVFVSTKPNQSVEDAFNNRYIKVEYGESINSQYLRYFSNVSGIKHVMTQPKLALHFLINNSSSAYLPEPMVKEYLKNKTLFLVQEAPIFNRDIYAMYLARGQRKTLIEQTLSYFE